MRRRVAVLINESHQAWNRNRITGALLMDSKSAFNNVSRGHLIGPMMELGGWKTTWSGGRRASATERSSWY